MVGLMKGDNIMLNKEKYAKEILDIVCETGSNPAVADNVPFKCDDIDCSRCNFFRSSDCSDAFVEWANSEYKEREIDWNKVPIDTPIYVWNNDDSIYKRYFAGYANNQITAFINGANSWSNNEAVIKWDNAKIKEGVDCSEWYKD
jgi:hypothetical protein